MLKILWFLLQKCRLIVNIQNKLWIKIYAQVFLIKILNFRFFLLLNNHSFADLCIFTARNLLSSNLQYLRLVFYLKHNPFSCFRSTLYNVRQCYAPIALPGNVLFLARLRTRVSWAVHKEKQQAACNYRIYICSLLKIVTLIWQLKKTIVPGPLFQK